jgi:hypothetical protein
MAGNVATFVARKLLDSERVHSLNDRTYTLAWPNRRGIGLHKPRLADTD